MSITAKGDRWCNIAISGTTELFDNEGLETKTSKEQVSSTLLVKICCILRKLTVNQCLNLGPICMSPT